MRVLVTGGAGYIGSVVAAQLVAAGHEVTVLDDLSTGHADAVPAGATFVKGTLRDCAAEVLADGIDGGAALRGQVAGRRVGRRTRPSTGRTTWAARWRCSRRCARSACARIVFSSTAAVYGEPERTPDRRDRPDPPDQPLRRVQARRRHRR